MTAIATHLTKSLILDGVRCAKALWLGMHEPDAAAPRDAAAQSRLEEGQQIGALAREWMGKGTLIDEPSSRPERAIAATRAALASGASILFEPAFEHRGVFVRVDLLRRDRAGWVTIVEAKSSTRVKDEHVIDLAIQRWVLAGDGHDVRSAALLVVDGAYERNGDVDPERLFFLHDQTSETAAALATVAETVERLHGVARQPASPAMEIGAHCNTPHACAFRPRCWADIPAGSIYDVAHLGDAAQSALRRRGVLFPRDIPPGFEVPARAVAAVEAARNGREQWNRDAVRAFLDSLRHPIRFLDFEAIGPAVPPFDRTRPYDRIPFQFSLHVQDAEGGPVRHVGRVGDPTKDFRRALASDLADAADGDGAILHWTAYERGCIERLAAWAAPSVARRLRAMLDRLIDLAEPFRTGDVVLPTTLGSHSVKRVLPALVPSLSYADLEVADGLAAARAFTTMMNPATPESSRTELRTHLERYCERDTLAMVEILAALRRGARS